MTKRSLGSDEMTSSTRRAAIANCVTLAIVCLVLFWATDPARADLGRSLAQLWEPSDSTPHPAVVRVTMVEPDGLSQGSGTLIDVFGEYGLVITNWHVVRGGGEEIRVQFPDGYESEAQLLKADQDWDLAVLAIWRPPTPPMPLATEAPQPGDPLTIAGYGQRGKFRAAHGRCTQYVSPGINLPFEMVEASATARQGDSGGPMINQHGELAGVLFGSSTGVTSGSYIGRVRWFLESVQKHVRENMTGPNGYSSDKLVRAEAVPNSFIPPRIKPARLQNQAQSDLRRQPNRSPHEQSAKVPPRQPSRTGFTDTRLALAETELGPAGQRLPNQRDHAAVAHLQPVSPPGKLQRRLPNASMPGRPVEVLTLDQLAGHTGWDKAKSLLAVVGLLTLLNQASILTGRR
jgi:hypothetical protein